MGKKRTAKTTSGLRMAQFTTVISISLVMTVLGLLITFWTGARQLMAEAREQFTLQIVLSQVVKSDEDLRAIVRGLENLPYTRAARHISKDEAAADYKATFNDDFEEVLDGVNPFPDIIELQISQPWATEDSVAAIQQELIATWPRHFVSITSDIQGLNELNEVFGKVSVILLSLLALLGIIMVALINITIRLSLFSRRFIIKTMQLVGASPRFIRRPFVRTGLLQGLAGGMLATLCLGGVLWALHREFPNMISMEFLKKLELLGAALPIASMLITGLSTRMAVGRFLRKRLENLY